MTLKRRMRARTSTRTGLSEPRHARHDRVWTGVARAVGLGSIGAGLLMAAIGMLRSLG